MKPEKAKKQRRDIVLYDMVLSRMVELRKHNHTQEYVAENTGLDIPHYESGRDFPTLTSLAVFCKLYGLTRHEFFAPLDYPSKE